MPYLQGYELEDASSTALADASAVAIAEPNRDFGVIQQAATTILAGGAPGLPGQVWDLIGPLILDMLLGGGGMSAAVATVDDLVPVLDALGYGNPPTGSVNADLSAAQAYDVGTRTAILDAIDAIQGSGGHTIEEVYNLGGVDPDTIWQWRPTVGDEQMYTLLQYAGRFGSRVADIGAIAAQNAPGFLLTGPWDASDANELPTDWPAVDWSGILDGDDLETYLDRADPAHNWTTDTNTGMVSAASTHGNSVGWYWVCRFTPAEFERLKATTVAASNVAPAWPGIDNVTLGTPVALSEGLTIAEEMNGVLIALTSLPPKTGSYTFDDKESYLHVGAVAFYSDNGDYEQAQSFSFVNHILMPKGLALAAGCVLRCKGATVGTATPFIIN